MTQRYLCFWPQAFTKALKELSETGIDFFEG